jgi:conjugal transfer pilus assembly protein TraF
MKYLKLCIIISFLFVSLNALAQNFYDQRYRGWFWYEDRQEKEQQTKEMTESFISPQAARDEMEQLAIELEEKKFVMFARPTPVNVKSYREKEGELWKKAEKLEESWYQANFRYPELNDGIKEPENVYAVKAQRALKAEQLKSDVREFARYFDLIAFFKNDCRYCHEFAPVFGDFVKEFGFESETVMLDDASQRLKGEALFNRLGMEPVTPMIVAISKDGSTAFELQRGFVTLNQLEHVVEQAWIYLESEEILTRKVR